MDLWEIPTFSRKGRFKKDLRKAGQMKKKLREIFPNMEMKENVQFHTNVK